MLAVRIKKHKFLNLFFHQKMAFVSFLGFANERF